MSDPDKPDWREQLAAIRIAEQQRTHRRMTADQQLAVLRSAAVSADEPDDDLPPAA